MRYVIVKQTDNYPHTGDVFLSVEEIVLNPHYSLCRNRVIPKTDLELKNVKFKRKEYIEYIKRVLLGLLSKDVEKWEEERLAQDIERWDEMDRPPSSTG